MHSQRVISHIYDDDAIENGIAADATSPSTLTMRDGARIHHIFPHLLNAAVLDSLLFLKNTSFKFDLCNIFEECSL